MARHGYTTMGTVSTIAAITTMPLPATVSMYVCVSASRPGPYNIHIRCAARLLSDTDGPVGMESAAVTCCRVLPVTATRSLVRTTAAVCLHYHLPHDCHTLRSTTDYADDNAGDDGDDYDHGMTTATTTMTTMTMTAIHVLHCKSVALHLQ